jgi:dienelactone hydrolase
MGTLNTELKAHSVAIGHKRLEGDVVLPRKAKALRTGAAAALVAAAQLPQEVAAVVSRGGRPDLAGDALSQVRAATLLIVGGADHGVIELNRDAFAVLTCEKRLEIVPGATHLFEEPGTLDKVVDLAAQWFNTHFEAAKT